MLVNGVGVKVVHPVNRCVYKGIASACHTLGQGIDLLNAFDGGKKEIGFSAFKNCRNLKSVEGIEEVIKIENGAFEGCTHLVSINMP